jgi:hypothetical protein
LEEFGACWDGREDPPTGNAALHAFHDLLMIALCSGQNATDMVEFAKAKEPFLREFLRLENGLPSHGTFSRLFRLLDPVKFGAAFQRLMAAFFPALFRGSWRSMASYCAAGTIGSPGNQPCTGSTPGAASNAWC